MHLSTHTQRAVFRGIAASLTLITGCALAKPVPLTGATASAAPAATTDDLTTPSPAPTATPTPLPQAFLNMPVELNAGINTSSAINSLLPQLYNPFDQSTEGATANGVVTALAFASQTSKLLEDAGKSASTDSPSGAALTSSDSIAVVLAALPVPPSDDTSTFAANLRESASFTTQALASGGKTIPLGSAASPLTLDPTSSPALKAGTSLKVYGSVSALTSSIFLTQLYMKAGSAIADASGSITTLTDDALLGYDTLIVSKKGMKSYALFVDPFTQAGMMMLQRTVTPTDTGATMTFEMDFRDFSSYKMDASGNFTTPGLASTDVRLKNFRDLVQNYSHAKVTLTYVKTDNLSGDVTVSYSDVRNFAGAQVMAAYSAPKLSLSSINNAALLAISNLK